MIKPRKGHPIPREQRLLVQRKTTEFWKNLTPEQREQRKQNISIGLTGRKLTELTKRKMRLSSKGKLNGVGAFEKSWKRILKEIPELERQGIKCIPVGKVIPDIIGIRDGKIIAIEIEYGKPNYKKYDKENFRKLYDDVIWIVRKRS